MVGCSVFGCKSRSESQKNDETKYITFHAFPTDPVLKMQWLEATGRENWQPTKFTKMCSLHFSSDAFIYYEKLVKIKKDALPCRNIHPPRSRDFESKPGSRDFERANFGKVQNIQSEKLYLEPSSKMENRTNSGGLVVEQTVKPMSTKEKQLQILLQMERTKSALRLKRLLALRQSKRRLLKRISDLESVVMELKSKMQTESNEINLSNIKTEI